MTKFKLRNIVLGRDNGQIARECQSIAAQCLRNHSRFILIVEISDLLPGVDPDEAALHDIRRTSTPGNYADDVILVRPGKPDRYLKMKNRDESQTPALSLVPKEGFQMQTILNSVADALEKSGRFDAVINNEDGTLMVIEDGLVVSLVGTEMVDPDAE